MSSKNLNNPQISQTEVQSILNNVEYWLEQRCGKPSKLTVDEEMRFTAYFDDPTAKVIGERILIMEQDKFLEIDGRYMSSSINRDGSESLMVRFFWTLKYPESGFAKMIKRIRGKI